MQIFQYIETLIESFKTDCCIAERNIAKLAFTSYTILKIRVILKRNYIKRLFLVKIAVREFSKLQCDINKCGYTTFDLF